MFTMSRGDHVDDLTGVPSRRERARVETAADIIRVARQVLVEQGSEGLALRAIARDLGMTAPALYRYFPSREDLVNHVVADIYDDLARELHTTRDTTPDPLEQLLDVARRFRRWALAHPREFGLVFVNPIRISRDNSSLADPSQAAGLRFAAVFAESLAALYDQRRFPVPRDEDIEPALRRELIDWQKRFPIDLPIGALLVFLTGWIRIYGMVCMEVFGHLRFALENGERMYEHEILVLADILGGRPTTSSGSKRRSNERLPTERVSKRVTRHG
jgi:AcrR family transcriptional regulator